MTSDVIIRDVAREFGVTLHDLRSRAPARALTAARIEVATRLRALRRLSWATIGRLLGRRSECVARYYGDAAFRARKREQFRRRHAARRSSGGGTP